MARSEITFSIHVSWLPRSLCDHCQSVRKGSELTAHFWIVPFFIRALFDDMWQWIKRGCTPDEDDDADD
jgi:hypothetical protein